jgi:hypothetical protein
MASTSKKAKVLAAFKYPMQIEVREAKFRPLASVAMLDLSRLRKGRHKIEIGFAEGGCCERSVSAVINNGVVANIEIEDCEGSKKPVTKEMLALIQAARREIGMPAPSTWHPIPVAQFFHSPARMGKIIIGWGNWCIQICIPLDHWTRCYYCCLWPARCGEDTIYTGPLL